MTTSSGYRSSASGPPRPPPTTPQPPAAHPAATTSSSLDFSIGFNKFIEEAERSLHDAIMIVRRARKNSTVVAGGGAIDMEVSQYLQQHAREIAGKSQLFINSYAKAIELKQFCWPFKTTF